MSDPDVHNNAGNNTVEREQHLIIAPVPAELVSVNQEILHLAESMRKLHESQNHLSFWMAVDINTAKAQLVPVPTLSNIEKMKHNYESLPTNVKDTIRRNTSDNDYDSFEEIMRTFVNTRELTIKNPPEDNEVPLVEQKSDTANSGPYDEAFEEG